MVLQRILHRNIQAIFLVITRRIDLTITLFSILFFPGVLLHEGSHYVTARLLRVPTGRFSILPQPLPNGKLQLGFVETTKSDWLRDALIGAAPLLVGGVFVAYAGLYQLNLDSLWRLTSSGNWKALLQGFFKLSDQPDFWIWFYLIFTVSSTMLPSASDRRAWLPLAIVGGLLLGLSYLAGVGPWMVENLAPPLNQFLWAIAVVFGISNFVHIILIIPVFLLSWSLQRLTGRQVH